MCAIQVKDSTRDAYDQARDTSQEVTDKARDALNIRDTADDKDRTKTSLSEDVGDAARAVNEEVDRTVDSTREVSVQGTD